MKITTGNLLAPLGLVLVGLLTMLTTAVLAAPKSDEPHRRLKASKGKDKPSDNELEEVFDPDFAYPADMPRPPMMWVEGFASRLHGGPIQMYETPIQVWQTWRLDQVRQKRRVNIRRSEC
jgi:hypothetical protein